jgi:hypothetical protein
VGDFDTKTLGKGSSASEIPTLVSYNEAKITLTIDDSMNYHYEKEYTRGSLSYSFPQDFFKGETPDIVYKQDPRFAVGKVVDNNGFMTYYNKLGEVYETFDFTDDGEFKNAGLDSIARKIMMIETVSRSLDPEKSLAELRLESFKKLKSKGVNLKEVSGNRMRISVKHEGSELIQLINLKTGNVLTEILLDNKKISSRQMNKYKEISGLQFNEYEIFQDFSEFNGKMDIRSETHIERRNILVEKF